MAFTLLDVATDGPLTDWQTAILELSGVMIGVAGKQNKKYFQSHFAVRVARRAGAKEHKCMALAKQPCRFSARSALRDFASIDSFSSVSFHCFQISTK